MPGSGSPTVRQRMLGTELRQARLRLGLSGEHVAGRLNWSAAKVSRIETARIGLRESDLEALLDLYKISGDQRQKLLALQRDAARKGWWEDYQDSLPQELTTLLGFEAEATEIRTWEPQVVPGLLQTEKYAWQIMDSGRKSTAILPTGVKSRVEVRMARQQVLLSGDSAVAMWVVLDESVLLRRYGEPLVMFEQLQCLLDFAARPNIRIQILPLDSALHPISTGSFIHLKFREYHDVVYLESLFSARFVEEEELVYGYERAFEGVCTHALGEEDSLAAIRQSMERWV
jgi:transcriptional regulator with XRE-family HTH domain